MPQVHLARLRAALATVLFTALVATANASAAAEPVGWDTQAGAERAASVIGVSAGQAAEDLSVQHEAFYSIQELIEYGDHVWFDNRDATVHVYGPETPAAIPPQVASHVVHDNAPLAERSPTHGGTGGACGTSRSNEDYCTPLEGGGRIEKLNGQLFLSCTAGFLVRDYSNNPYMITAGHCADWGTTFYTNGFKSSTSWPNYKECVVGPWVGGESPWGGHDAAITPVTGCGGMTAYAHNWINGVNTHIEGATNTQYVGEYVCHFGIATLYQCGVIHFVSKSYKISYENIGPQEYTVNELDFICGAANHGDSGGPVTDGTYPGVATGIMISLGTDVTDCGTQGNGAFFTEQRIFTILNLFNVYVASG